MTQWRLVREYASVSNAKRAIPSLKKKLGTYEIRWSPAPNAKLRDAALTLNA
jgi:hypothetical protein